MKFTLIFISSVAIALGFSFANETKVSKLIGEKEANPSQFPHQISLQFLIKGVFDHLCGGAIISKYWVLTAAHCINSLETEDYRLVAGLFDIQNVSGTQQRQVLEIYEHPDFEGGYRHDIALFQVKIPFEFNENVKPIKLPKPNEDFLGEAVVSGWGSTSRNHTPIFPNHLQSSNLTLYKPVECMKALHNYRPGSESLFDFDVHICTGPTKEGKGTCSGDSGGPLVQDNILVGIVSWGIIPCGNPFAPSVFTKVSYYIDFIKEFVKDL